MAERAGLSVRGVSNLERGTRHYPYPHTVRQLAKALRLSAADRIRLEAAAPARPGRSATAEPAPVAAGNLPLPLTSFVGRRDEMADITRLLAAHRLVTLTGAGGVGKTRLALAVAAERAGDYPDGTWLIELAALTDGALVPATIAHAVGLADPGRRPMLDALADWVADRHVLLVLDNCEHLLNVCAHVVETLLRRCGHLRLLVTSRESLGLLGQVSWRVPSLTTPPAHQAADPAVVLTYEAVRLFEERVQAVQPRFAVTAANAAEVAWVCRRLDGLPLAIELAAARLAALTIDQVAERLNDRFLLLTGGSRTAMPRHQTLRAVIDWSYDLLSAPERTLLHRLSVFAGGWTLAGAEAIGAGDDMPAGDIAILLSQLVDKSLAQADSDQSGAARFRLLETVRQYAAERLVASGEEGPTRDRHAAWCLTLAETAAPQLVGDTLLPWLERLDVEQDNLRAALAWLLERDAAAGLRLAASLRHAWLLHSRLSEGRHWFDLLLPRSLDPTATRVRALLGAAFAARLQGRDAASVAYGEEALALSRALGETRLTAEALHTLAGTHVIHGDVASARPLLEEGVALCRAIGDRDNLGEHLYYLGRLAQEEGDYRRARALLEECLVVVPVGHSAGDLAQAGATHYQMGVIASGIILRGANNEFPTLVKLLVYPLTGLVTPNVGERSNHAEGGGPLHDQGVTSHGRVHQ